ncbi:MAG: hypothetical protein U5L96_02045 [Owenweeksia sp.]|nr:hypothetical protein [Owenweeksia sp.]
MRIFHLQSTVLLAVIVLISGCSTGRRAFERGDYDKAVYQAVNRLRNDSDNRKASATLRRAYNYAVNTHLKQVEKKAKSSNPYRWERVVDHYRAINALHDEILYCPACLSLIPEPKSYADDLSNARQQAAEQRYQMAQKALENKEMRSNALMAHRHLLVVQQMMPGYKNTANLLEEAMYFATLHVLVEPIPAPTTIMQLNQEFLSIN